ncbi:MAG: hypothetical protein EP344_14605 [Bacteroidetes bacterium]|nr:MAG: hypothetical protein EP344_14605 [Bacteroidota bacterium]
MFKVLRTLPVSLHILHRPKRRHTYWGVLVVLLICFGFMWLKHHTWLSNLNGHMLGTAPDGIKNYMTTIWHVRYDSSYVHYDGMNYPFGEHVLFTDNQPIFSALLQWWSHNISDLNGHIVGAMNRFMAFSLLFSALVLFLLLRRINLPAWYAGLATLGILFLSPQHGRFAGHFALAHIWVFPLLLLLLHNYEERYSRRYQALLIGLLLWISAQLHFYYFGLSALFLGLYTAYRLLLDRRWPNWRSRISHFVLMVIIPFALLNGWVQWSDYAADRPSSPYGFTTYIGEWEGVFLPYEDFPLYQWIDQHLVSIRRVNGEAKAYAGMLAFFFTLWLLVSGFRMFGKSWDKENYHQANKRYLQGIFTAALALLVFACGFPFAIPGMEWLVDYMGPLRQFRGLGRFTWAYFYVINLLAFYSLWNWSVRFEGFRNGKAKWFRWVIALAPVLVLSWEAYTFQRLRPLELMDSLEKREVVAPTPEHWLDQVDFTQYQALLPLPYYHIGSENIWLPFDYLQFIEVQSTAIHTGKPDMGVNLSRTSCQQTIRSVQLVLEPGIFPSILNDFPDSRPLAVLVRTSAWEEVRQRYAHLIDIATMVYDGPEMKVLSLSPDKIRTGVRQHNLNVELERRGRILRKRGEWQCSNLDGALIYQSYDSLLTTEQTFQGMGAYTGNMGDTTNLWQGSLPKGQYVLSCWLYVNQDLGMNHELKLFENNRDDNREVQFKHEGMQYHLKSIVRNWGLFEIPFEVREDNSRLRIFLFKQNAQQPFFLDEFLIRPQGTDVYRQERYWVVRNNYWYKL